MPTVWRSFLIFVDLCRNFLDRPAKSDYADIRTFSESSSETFQLDDGSMTSEVRKNMQPVDPEEVARLIRQADAAKTLPAAIFDDPSAFLRTLYSAWVMKGGQVAGKPRNSLRQITDLLKSDGSEVPSIQQKLAGQVRLTKGETLSLVKLFLTHWDYVGSPRTTRATSEDYETILDVNVQEVCDALVAVLFPEGRTGVVLPPRDGQRKPTLAVKRAPEVFAECYPEADALITVSCHRTIIAPTIPTRLSRFRRAVNQFWDIDKQDEHERVLIWVVDMGSRRFDDEDALTAFSNVETLAAAFRALAMFDDSEAEARWLWLKTHTVFIVGSLRPDEIDSWQEDKNQTTRSSETKWPFISAQHILLGALPPEWVGAPELPIIYGPRLEEFDNRAFTIFLRETGWNNTSKTGHSRRLRYFAYGPVPTEHTYRGSPFTQPLAVSLELSSPELRYDEAFQLVCAAASHRTQKVMPKSMEAEFPPLEALAHLRHLGFAVLRLEQFIRLSDNLSPQ